MRASIVTAAHNEGQALWRTVASVVETCAGLDHEIVVADDASWDGSVAEVRRRFPQVRVVRHDERRGTSATKDTGARHARGDVLVFLDGHTKPEDGAIRRLVEDVEALKGEAVVTPAVAGLDVSRWKSIPGQIGHGYFLELERFDCGWMPLSELKQVRHQARTFYESPALIGCALAIHRELYDELRGFDAHMRSWGVEDLDFGLKSWLLGHPILHDPEAVIGHRFRRRFDNFDVPVEHLVANQLRMARKNFTEGVWREWVERCRRRHPGRLPEHPEGLWAAAWDLFQERRPSVEHERSYLMARRVRDEFWYAERFGLLWPRLQAGRFEPEATAMPLGLLASPSPPPCKVTEVTPETAMICVGHAQEFTAKGDSLDDVEWSTQPPGDPATGSGPTFSTRWSEPGVKTVTASCDESSAQADVTVVSVEKVIVDGSEPEDEGPAAICFGESITLRAKPNPAESPFPQGSPVWEIVQKPDGSQVADPAAGSSTAEVEPDVPGSYEIKASCGTSSKTFTLHAVQVTLTPAGAQVGDPVRVGYQIQRRRVGNQEVWDRERPIWRRVIATVVPAAAAPKISLRLAGAGKDRVLTREIARIPETETMPFRIIFEVGGKQATPAGQPAGDTIIEAVVNEAQPDEAVCAEMRALVLVPTSLQVERPQEVPPGLDPNTVKWGAPAVVANIRGHGGSRPPISGVRPGMRRRVTLYGHDLRITVLDQFGSPLDSLYRGKEVWESARFIFVGQPPPADWSPWSNIFQRLDGQGRYTDPVGAIGFLLPDRAANHQDIRDWTIPNAPRAPLLATSEHTQNIRVRVAGHELQPSPAISNRRIIPTTNPDQVQIIWP